MSYLNDTSVISQFTKALPEPLCMSWIARTRVDQMFFSVMTILEIRLGIDRMPAGKRRISLAAWLHDDLPRRFEKRILPVTYEIADDAGKLMAKCQAIGQNIEAVDALIASTARIHGFAVATLNRKHFRLLDVRLVDF